jgi:hypothetical protein
MIGVLAGRALMIWSISGFWSELVEVSQNTKDLVAMM